jgi:hypothetical protein
LVLKGREDLHMQFGVNNATLLSGLHWAGLSPVPVGLRATSSVRNKVFIACDVRARANL